MYRPIIGTLGYVLSHDRKKTLLVHRNSRPGDHHLYKYNGLGGKMMDNEDVVSCIRREIREEAGIACEEILLRGTINWTGFGPDGASWFGFIFRIDKFIGTPYAVNDEGELTWVDIADLHTVPMWKGDRYFLPMVFDDDPRVFHGYMPYEDGEPRDWRYVRI